MIDTGVHPCVVRSQGLQGEAQVGAGDHSLPESRVDGPPGLRVMNGQKLVLLLPVDLSHRGCGGGQVTL